MTKSGGIPHSITEAWPCMHPGAAELACIAGARWAAGSGVLAACRRAARRSVAGTDRPRALQEP